MLGGIKQLITDFQRGHMTPPPFQVGACVFRSNLNTNSDNLAKMFIFNRNQRSDSPEYALVAGTM